MKAKVNVRIAIVAGRFNDFITQRLLSACSATLIKLGVSQKNITTYWVPGSFEIPVTALKCAKSKNIDAVICLGAIIRGDTYHFDVIANESARGMMQVMLQTGKPVINGVLTCDTMDQAYKRAQTARGDNKGRDAAQNALDMVYLLKAIK